MKNTFGKLSFIFGIFGLMILFFLILPAVIGIDIFRVFFHIDIGVNSFFNPERIAIFLDFILGITAIILSKFQINRENNKMAKIGNVIGIIICVISLPFVIIGLFAG